MEKQKGWFRRHWILTIFLGILLIGAIGSMFDMGSNDLPDGGSLKMGEPIYSGNSNNNSDGNISPIVLSNAETEDGEDIEKNPNAKTKDKENIEKDPIDLLPTRNEVDTEWEDIEINSKSVDATGFNSGVDMDMYRMESLSMSNAYISIYKFDSNAYADSFYSSEVQKVKSEGGYTEISTSGISATCFGYKGGDAYEGYYYSFYCKKDNLFFLSEVATFNYLRLGYAKDLAKIVADKI